MMKDEGRRTNMNTKIETITVTNTIHHAGSTIVKKGTIRLRMPSNYNPAFVTADDIENNPALEIVGDEPEPMDIALQSLCLT